MRGLPSYGRDLLSTSRMMLFDLAYLAGAIAFFAAATLAVRACERL